MALQMKLHKKVLIRGLIFDPGHGFLFGRKTLQFVWFGKEEHCLLYANWRGM